MRKISVSHLFVIFLLVGLLYPVEGKGQLSSNDAGVTSLSIVPLRGLAFSELVQGAWKRVRPVSIGGVVQPIVTGGPKTGLEVLGEFEVSTSSPTGLNVAFSFILPNSLNETRRIGFLPLSFQNTDAGWKYITQTGIVLFNPTIGTTCTLPGNNLPVKLYIGGMVSPQQTAPVGSYTGTIVLTVTALP